MVTESDGTAIEVRLLGPVEAVAGERPVELGGPRQRTLLALLALDPGRPRSAGWLAEELWRGSPPGGAETTLRSYVSRLRRALGQAAVAGDSAGYALALPPAQVDARRFERLLREGRGQLERGAAGLASERLRAALGLWRGRALADVADDGALADEALRLDELRLLCLEARIGADLELGRHEELVPELRALAQEHGLRERFRHQLALALYRSGRQAEALEACREARRLLDEELGLEPGEELRELERAILRHEVAPVAPAEERHNLPAQTTSFGGREAELAELRELLRAHRLVTLTGMGGAGKTRLALEAARQQVEAWSDGVWLVDLTAVAHPELVTAAVAQTLAVGDDAPDALLAYVRRLELLLVLDNCEHVVDACAELAESLLRAAPNLRVLATSRVPLRTAGERDYAVDPLAERPAVELFLERAGAVRRGLGDDARAGETVGAICRELDGLPLAIELAAARAKALSLEEIAARLDDRFRFLRAWRRVTDPRHRTLETTMDWSYGLLAADEQRLLRGLSVFAGGATLDAIAEICDGDEELLGRLVDASLVRADIGARTRYRLLETVRQYAAAKLDEDPAAPATRRRHAEHFLALAEGSNLGIESLYRGPQRHEPVLREQHNLRAALDWAAANDAGLGLRMMVALENFWITQALEEGARRYEQLLERPHGVDLRLLGYAWRDYGACLDVLGEAERARAAYTRSGEVFREAGDAVGEANARFRLGVVAALFDEDYARARRLYEESLDVFRRHDDRLGELQALASLGVTDLFHGGDRERGRALVEQSLEMAREIGWVWWQCRHLGALALAALEVGDAQTAERHAREFAALTRTTGSRSDTIYALALVARAAAARGDVERALALWATVEASEQPPGRFGRFDRAAYAAAMPAGPRPEPLPLDDAVALALS